MAALGEKFPNSGHRNSFGFGGRVSESLRHLMLAIAGIPSQAGNLGRTSHNWRSLKKGGLLLQIKDVVYFFLVGIFFLAYGYNIWPKRKVPVSGPDKKGRSLIFGGYSFLAVSALGMILHIFGISWS